MELVSIYKGCYIYFVKEIWLYMVSPIRLNPDDDVSGFAAFETHWDATMHVNKNQRKRRVS